MSALQTNKADKLKNMLPFKNGKDCFGLQMFHSENQVLVHLNVNVFSDFRISSDLRSNVKHCTRHFITHMSYKL